MDGDFMEIFLEKTMYSEWVVRNSLYWMSTISNWKLTTDIHRWVVYFDSLNEEVEFEFFRLLNDYKLREKLQAQTGNVRASIIESVLRSIDSRLAQ